MHRNQPLLVLPAAFIVACVLAGCSGHRPPTITVGDAVVTARTDEALQLEIALDLTNEGDETLELRELSYAVSIDGVTVYDGKRAAEASLSASGAKRLLLPAVVRFDAAPWEGAPPSEAAWSIRGRLLYVTPGQIAEILLDTGVRKPRVIFAGSGRLRLAAGPSP